jgi:hypothetical protein
LNLQAIDPARGASLETIARVAAVATVTGDRYHPRLGVTALNSDDDQLN